MQNNRRSSRQIVLVVDDDPRCRDLVARTVRRAGFDVLVASDGYQATTILTRSDHPIRLLVVDTEMPGVHGWEVIRFAAAKSPRTRILRLGRTDDIVPAAEYQRFRSVAALPKPFTRIDLLARVRTAEAASAPVRGQGPDHRSLASPASGP